MLWKHHYFEGIIFILLLAATIIYYSLSGHSVTYFSMAVSACPPSLQYLLIRYAFLPCVFYGSKGGKQPLLTRGFVKKNFSGENDRVDRSWVVSNKEIECVQRENRVWSFVVKFSASDVPWRQSPSFLRRWVFLLLLIERKWRILSRQRHKERLVIYILRTRIRQWDR